MENLKQIGRSTLRLFDLHFCKHPFSSLLDCIVAVKVNDCDQECKHAFIASALPWRRASVLVIRRAVCWLTFLRSFYIPVMQYCGWCVILWWEIHERPWFQFDHTNDCGSLAAKWSERTQNRLITGKLSPNLARVFLFGSVWLWEQSRGMYTRDVHSVLHGSFSWLFISRRGRLCRRWMFLRTARGTRSTCRFCAVVSWMEILIDFGSAIFSRTCWKSPGWGWCDVTPTLGHLICLIVSVIKILHVGGGESTGYQYFSWHCMIFWWSCANTANLTLVLAQLPFQQLLRQIHSGNILVV